MAVSAPLAGSLPTGLIALPGVYQPQGDTRLLAAALQREEVEPRARVLEIGTGTGALALQAASRGARVTAVDVSWRAVATARLNAGRRRLPLHVVHGDFETATAGHHYDLIISNPPYVPAPGDLPTSGPERAWDAGPDGRAVIDRICQQAPALLNPGGALLMVHSGMCGVQKSLDHLAAGGLHARVCARADVPWGPVLRSRQTWLQRQGFASGPEELEELVVIRAHAL
ncbi:HemK2/MTQ2 family protein methyltransferase [Streptomyces sp. NPDC048507]|uniref:HemK2/MTQ2 family protein methyltransferase n=1 Tax=Streptomyces sp. NPDC048507 TaxID=3365560 RepID=UPI00371FE419